MFLHLIIHSFTHSLLALIHLLECDDDWPRTDHSSPNARGTHITCFFARLISGCVGLHWVGLEWFITFSLQPWVWLPRSVWCVGPPLIVYCSSMFVRSLLQIHADIQITPLWPLNGRIKTDWDLWAWRQNILKRRVSLAPQLLRKYGHWLTD